MLDEVISQLKAIVLPTDQVKRVSTKSAYLSPGRGKRVVLSRLWYETRDFT